MRLARACRYGSAFERDGDGGVSAGSAGFLRTKSEADWGIEPAGGGGEFLGGAFLRTKSEAEDGSAFKRDGGAESPPVSRRAF